MNNTQKKKEADNLRVQATEAGKNRDFQRASFFAASSLKLYGECGNKNGIADLKKLVVEYNKETEKLMTEHEFSIDLDEKNIDEIQKLVNNLTQGKTLGENLERIVKTSTIVPSYKVAQENAKNIIPVTAQIFTHMEIGADGHLSSFNDFDTGWVRDNYSFQMDITTKILNLIFSELIAKKQYTEKNIMDVVLSKGLFYPDHLLKLQASLERRFANDYFSAVHILVPLVEKTFMSLSGLVGLDNISFNGKTVSTRSGMLSSDLLESKEYRAMWGEDFCQMLNFFLLDARAYRFRHKVAHGDITVPECNFTSFNILFFFIIKMILMIKTND